MNHKFTILLAAGIGAMMLFATAPMSFSKGHCLPAADQSTMAAQPSRSFAADQSTTAAQTNQVAAGQASAQTSQPTAGPKVITPWGDQGNGIYINPILAADYSDPDVIRVGEKYYMVASDFHFIGMQILESDDMVNWRIVTQVYDSFDLPGWDSNEKYAGGSWAPALRYHDGRFYIYFCTPHEGLFMTSAEKAEGPWEELHIVAAVPRWEDPCPFWDEDGQAYLGHSKVGAGPIIIHKMSPDGKTLLDDGLTVYTGPVAEGVKFHKLNGYYYISIPEGGVERGWQTILRAKDIYGPYEKKVVLEKGSTDINGPHQGSMVDTPDGQWWFYHFQHAGAIGRVVHLQPMYWSEDGWPVIGVDIDRNGIGEPVRVWTTPASQSAATGQATAAKQGQPILVVQPHQSAAIKSSQPSLPQNSDDFSSENLSPQWQWNHNPVPEAWSLSKKPGKLTIDALYSPDFWKARNTLTQKTMGFESETTVCLEFGEIAEGGRAGLCTMGKGCGLVGVKRENGRNYIYYELDGKETDIAPVKGKKIWLRASIDFTSEDYRLSYSSDGKKFTQAGDSFYFGFGSWKGVRFGLFHFNKKADGGSVSFDDVVVETANRIQ